MATSVLPATTFLDPAVLARIGNLELLARTVVEGFINGLHRSPHLGSSTDFAEHRPYMPGDDIRRIDWKLYARTDRHFVKEFEADTNTNLLLLLDVSPSMRYRGDGVSKLEYGCFLAASLAYFSSGQRDRVGLATFDRDLLDYVPCSAKHLRVVLRALDRACRVNVAAAGGGAGPRASALAVPLEKLSESTRKRSIVVLISDLYEEPEAVLSALANVRGRRNELIVFHVLDRNELEFPFTEATNFVDLETGEKMPLVPDYLRSAYKDLLAQHTRALGRQAQDQRVDYARLSTAKPLDEALFAYLASRQRHRATRR